MAPSKRTVEVRLIVIAVVHLDAPELTEVLAAKGGKPVSIAEAISSVLNQSRTSNWRRSDRY